MYVVYTLLIIIPSVGYLREEKELNVVMAKQQQKNTTNFIIASLRVFIKDATRYKRTFMKKTYFPGIENGLST